MSEILTQQQRNWILDALPKGPAQDILSAIDSHESRRVRAAEQHHDRVQRMAAACAVAGTEMSEFKREDRYVVLKRKDAAQLPRLMQLRLSDICAHIRAIRRSATKEPLRCVVVESDWPEYETVWKMIEDRMTGRAPSAEHLVTARALYFDPEDAARLDYETAGEPTTGAEQQQREPVKWIKESDLENIENLVYCSLFSNQMPGLVPLYTHQQPISQVGQESYVQPVPHHCDRITWRNQYYHLNEHQQPQAQITVRVKRDPVSGELLADDKPQAQGEPVDWAQAKTQAAAKFAEYYGNTNAEKEDIFWFGWNRCMEACEQPRAAVPDGLVVTKEGIQFGPNCFYSHERIAGHTAEQLNSGQCKLTARKYMEWVASRLAAAPAQPMCAAVPDVDKIMAQAQVFASSWSLVGGQFDDGSMLETAEQEKEALRQMLTAAAPAQPGEGE